MTVTLPTPLVEQRHHLQLQASLLHILSSDGGIEDQSRGSEQKLLLLSSTERLLSRLGLDAWLTPGDEDKKAENRSSGDTTSDRKEGDGGEPDFIEFTKLGISNEVADEIDNIDHPDGDDTAPDNNDSAQDRETSAVHQKDPKEKKGKGKGKKEATTPPELLQLHRTTNLVSIVQSALGDIQRFKDRNLEVQKTKQADSGRLHKLDARRHQALEHERNRLQKQQKEREQSTGSSAASAELKDDENGGQESGDKQEVDIVVIRENAWIRIIRTLNSLAVATHVLLDMLFHPHRNNKQIRLGKASLVAPKGRSPRCWLFGSHIFDVCTVGECKSLHNLLLQIYAAMGFLESPPASAANENVLHTLDWRAHLDKLMGQICRASFHNNNLDSSAATNLVHPLQPLVSEMQAREAVTVNLHRLDHLMKRLDVHFGFSDDAKSNKTKQAEFQRSINQLQQRAQFLLHQRFRSPSTRLSVYGSCVSNLSLGRNSDVDMSLNLQEMVSLKQSFESGQMTSVSQFDSQRRSIVYQVCRKLERYDDFVALTPVAHARVPVIKGTWTKARNPYSTDGSIAFDICLCNDIAVVNSSLVREYCSVDQRIRYLCKAVKSWAKANGISSAAEQTLSSYTWINMVIIYLLQLGLVPNLQCPELAKKAGVSPQPQTNEWHCVNNLDTFFLTWKQVQPVWKPPPHLKETPVAVLLFGFFDYFVRQASPLFVLGLHPNAACGGRGTPFLPKTVFATNKGSCSWFLAIQDPFETHDAHRSHDLGAHASDPGIVRIWSCLHRAHAHLKQILLGMASPSSSADDTLPSLPWPKPSAVGGNEKSGSKGQQQETNHENKNNKPTNRRRDFDENKPRGNPVVEETSDRRSHQDPQNKTNGASSSSSKLAERTPPKKLSGTKDENRGTHQEQQRGKRSDPSFKKKGTTKDHHQTGGANRTTNGAVQQSTSPGRRVTAAADTKFSKRGAKMATKKSAGPSATKVITKANTQ